MPTIRSECFNQTLAAFKITSIFSTQSIHRTFTDPIRARDPGVHQNMAFSDEVSFLEQHIQLLNRGALQEALQMACARLQNLKLNPHTNQFDPKVRVLIFNHIFE